MSQFPIEDQSFLWIQLRINSFEQKAIATTDLQQNWLMTPLAINLVSTTYPPPRFEIGILILEKIQRFFVAIKMRLTRTEMSPVRRCHACTKTSWCHHDKAVPLTTAH